MQKRSNLSGMSEPSTDTTPDYLRALLSGPPALEDDPVDDAPPPAATLVEPQLAEIERRFPEEHLDPDAVKIVRRLAEGGHTAYLVGGCLRDLLFGVRPKDFDIVTSAEPAQIKKLFRNCRIIGRRFRLAHIFFRNKIIEVATFRSQSTEPHNGDGELLIRDDNVFGNPDEDAVRRDFTINALFYDVDRGVILDYVGGVADAEKRLVRCIGDPNVRLREDPIRMLRAIRLAARLGAEVEPGLAEGITRYREEILQAASPRILEDLLRMFRGGAMAPAFDMMLAYGVLEVLIPELYALLREETGEDDRDEVEALRNMLRTADRWAQNGRELAACTQLALLLSPVLMRPIEDTGVRDAGATINDILKPIAQRLSISRKDSERMRQVLLAQGRLVPGRKGGRRRFSMSAFLGRAYFSDALDLFEVMTESTGDLRERAAKWRQRLREAFPDGPPAETKKRPTAPRRRARRDRR